MTRARTSPTPILRSAAATASKLTPRGSSSVFFAAISEGSAGPLAPSAAITSRMRESLTSAGTRGLSKNCGSRKSTCFFPERPAPSRRRCSQVSGAALRMQLVVPHV